MTKEEIITRGQAAADILENGIFAQVFQAFERHVAEQWKATPPQAEKDRERMYLMIQLQAEYVRILTAWRGEAQLESHRLDQARKERDGATLN